MGGGEVHMEISTTGLDKKKHPDVLNLPDVSYPYLLSGLVSTQPAASLLSELSCRAELL